MTFHLSNSQLEPSVFLLAHNGVSHHRSSARNKTDLSTSHESNTLPESHNTDAAKTSKPSPVESSVVSVSDDQTTLANSVMGFPFGLGELSFGLILAGPVFLSAIRRWLQS